MGSRPKVYVAGVGYSSSAESFPVKNVTVTSVSAATKALVDAGLSYDDVSNGIVTKGSGVDAFKAFDEGGVTINEVERGSELESAFQLVEDRRSHSVLVIAVEQSAVMAVVLISENKLWRHPYLKDSSALIRKLNSGRSNPQSGLHELCQIVWLLRGWSQNQGKSGEKLRVPYSNFELSRSDEQPIPEWKDVIHRQDGKYRLGYNPATESQEISIEDFEAVRGSGRKYDMAQRNFKKGGGDRAALKKGAAMAKL